MRRKKSNISRRPKYIFQKSFDRVLEKHPGLEQAFAEHKSAKALTRLRTAYDKAGRITGVLRAGGDNISTQYDEQATGPCITAGPRVVLTTNALGQRTTEVKNVLGETVESFDENCGQVSLSTTTQWGTWSV